MECKPREARRRRWKRLMLFLAVLAASVLGLAPAALAEESTGGEANLVLPDLGSVSFHGIAGSALLAYGLIICALGLVFGMVIFFRLRKLPAHKSMKEISELIWQTCKTYLLQQGQFLIMLWVFIAVVIGVYFGCSQRLHRDQGHRHPALQHPGHPGQLRRGLVRHPRQHLCQLPHRFRQPQGQALRHPRHPDAVGHERGHDAHQRRAHHHADHPHLDPARLRRRLLHRLRHRRVAGRGRSEDRRRYLHQDRRHRLRPDEDRLQHQGRRRAEPRASSPTAPATTRATRSAPAPTASRPTASPAWP